jgi:RNA polymerase sigma factor (sigma-70 family)
VGGITALTRQRRGHPKGRKCHSHLWQSCRDFEPEDMYRLWLIPMRESEFRQLVRENTPAVAGYLRRRLYPLPNADLDDLIEETLIVAWKRIDRAPPGAERPWLISVARNVLHNARRAQRRRSRMESSLRRATTTPSAEMWALASVSIRSAMEHLSPSDREVIMLHNWDGLDVAGIAVALGISTDAAESRLTRAHKRFQAAFGADGAGFGPCGDIVQV